MKNKLTQDQIDKIKRIEEIVISNLFKYVWEDPEGYYTEDEKELHELRNDLQKENINVIPDTQIKYHITEETLV